MTLPELHQFLLNSCYKAPEFSLKQGMLSSPGIDFQLTSYFGTAGLLLSKADAPVLNGDNITVANGIFAAPWLKSPAWRVMLTFRVNSEGQPVLQIKMDMPPENYTLGSSFISLAEHPAGLLPLNGLSFHTRSDAPAPALFQQMQERFVGQLYHTDDDETFTAPLEVAATASFPEGMKWMENWVPADMRKVTGIFQLKANDGDSPRFLLSSPVYTLPLPGYFSLDTQLQAFGLWCDATDTAGTSVFTVSALRFLAKLNYTIEGEQPLVIPVQCVWNSLDPGVLFIEAETGAAVSYALSKFAALLGGIDMGSWLPEGVALTDLVTLKRIGLQCDVKERKIRYISAELGLPDDKPPFPLIPDIAYLTKLRLYFTVLDPLGQKVTGAELGGAITFKNAVIKGPVEAQLSLPNGSFSVGLGTGASIDLSELYKQLLPAYPIPVSDLKCSELSVEGDFRPLAFRFAAQLSSQQGISLYFLKVMNVGFAFNYGSGSAEAKSLQLSGTAIIGEKVQLQVGAVIYEKGFRFTGELTPAGDKKLLLSDLLPKDVELPDQLAGTIINRLAIGFDTNPVSLTFILACEATLDFGEPGKITFNGLSITASKDEKGYSFKFKTSGGLHLVPTEEAPNGLIDLAGEISIDRTPEQFKMSFTANDQAKGLTMPLLIPAKVDESGVHFSEGQFTPKNFDFTWDKKQWKIESSFKFKIVKTWVELQKLLDRILPQGISVTLAVGSQEASIKLDGDIVDFVTGDFVLPAPGEGLQPLNLGPSKLKVGDISLKLAYRKKTALTVEASASYFLPTRLNHIFGTTEDGKPKLEILDTYDPNVATTPISFRFYAGYKDGQFKAGVSLNKFPLKNIGETEDGKSWLINLGPLEADKMGKYGCISIQKPEMDFNTGKGGFTLSGGWDIKKQLAIPLDLLRNLLAMVGNGELAKRIPESLPIPNRVEFFKDNKLDTGAINAFFLNQLPKELLDALQLIAGYTVDKFPDAIKPYFSFGLPSGLSFECNVTATASVTIDLKVTDPGLRMLFIQPVPAPYILGTTIRKFSFGQIFGGQAFRVKIDGDFDMFDMVSLATSMVAQPSWYPYIGNPSQYHNTLMLHDLIVLIFYQAAGVPIPVPVFFNKVGVDYYGIGDTTFKSSFEFPEPDYSKLGPMLINLVRFFTDKKFPMPENGEAPTIKFVIGENYIKSGLLKIGPLGLTEPITPVDLYKFMASAMNTVKFFDVEQFIRSLPVDKRVGAVQADLSFVCIRIKASWLLSTPYEFMVGKLYERFLSGDESPTLFMKILPGNGKEPVTEKDKGLVLFLKGEWSTAFGSLKTGFGVVALNTRKFGTGFFVRGVVASFFEVSAEAFLVIDPPDRPFKARGESLTKFTLINFTIFDGETDIDLRDGPDKIRQFYVTGRFTLLDLPPLFSIRSSENMGGEFSGETLHLMGGVVVQILGIFNLSGSAEVGNRGIEINVLNITRLTVLKRNDYTIQVGGRLPFGLTFLSLDVIISNPPQGENYIQIDSSVSFVDLITLRISSRSAIHPTPPGFSASVKLFILESLNPNPIIEGSATIGNELSVTAGFSLLPSDALNIRGNATVTITGGGFSASGSANLYVAWVPIIGGTVIVNNEGIRFYTSDGAFDLRVQVCQGKLFLIGKLKIGAISGEGYISTDGRVCPGFPDECRRSIARLRARPAAQFDQFNTAIVMLTAKVAKQKKPKKGQLPAPIRTTLVEDKYRVTVKSKYLGTGNKELITEYKAIRLAETGRGKDLFTELLAYLRKKGGDNDAAFVPSATGAILTAMHSSLTSVYEIEVQFPAANSKQVHTIGTTVHQEDTAELHDLLAADFKKKVRELRKENEKRNKNKGKNK